VRNEEVLQRVKAEKNIVHTIKRRKTDWIGHILRRNCLTKHVIEGNIKIRIEVKGKRGRRRKQLLNGRKERRGYWKLKVETPDRALWGTCFRRHSGTVVRQKKDELMKEGLDLKR